MPEITIRYKNSKTLDALKDLSKYFDFSILLPKKPITKKGEILVNGVKMIQGSGIIDDAEMNEVFTKSAFKAEELRSKWQRRK